MRCWGKGCVLQGLKGEHGADCGPVCLVGEEASEEKIGLLVKEEGNYGIQRRGHSAFFVLISARKDGTPGTRAFNKCLMQDVFVLIFMPCSVVTLFLPLSVRILAARRMDTR